MPFLHEAEDGRATLDWLAATALVRRQHRHVGRQLPGLLPMGGGSHRRAAVEGAGPAHHPSNLMHYPRERLSHGSAPAVDVPDGQHGQSHPGHPRPDAAAEQRRSAGSVPAARRFTHLPLLTADEVAIGHVSSALPGDGGLPTRPIPTGPLADHSARVAQSPPADFTSGWYDLFLDELLKDFSCPAGGRQSAKPDHRALAPPGRWAICPWPSRTGWRGSTHI